jgi:cellobiose-specific phosphotransferase system component IIB
LNHYLLPHEQMKKPLLQMASLDVQRKLGTVSDCESQIDPYAPLFFQGGVPFPLQRQQLDAVVYAPQVQHHYRQLEDAATQNPQAQDDEI